MIDATAKQLLQSRPVSESPTYELRNERMIYKNGLPFLSIHRCLDHTGAKNPAGMSGEDTDAFLAAVIALVGMRKELIDALESEDYSRYPGGLLHRLLNMAV